MKNTQKGLFLQHFMTFAITLGGVGMMYPVVTFAHVYGGVSDAWAGAIFLVGAISIVLSGPFLTAKLFRWYNTEQAIKQALEDRVPFQDALMIDHYWRNGAAAAASATVTGSMTLITRLDARVAFWAVGAICSILFVAAAITMSVVACISLKWYRERRPYGDEKIPMWYRERTVGDQKIRSLFMLPVAKAPGLYR